MRAVEGAGVGRGEFVDVGGGGSTWGCHVGGCMGRRKGGSVKEGRKKVLMGMEGLKIDTCMWSRLPIINGRTLFMDCGSV